MLKISDYLGTGRENARSGRYLCRLLGIPMRTLTKLIELERQAGAPICAATGRNPGYFLAKNKREMREYCGSLYRRGGNVFATRAACMKTIDSLPD